MPRILFLSKRIPRLPGVVTTAISIDAKRYQREQFFRCLLHFFQAVNSRRLVSLQNWRAPLLPHEII